MSRGSEKGGGGGKRTRKQKKKKFQMVNLVDIREMKSFFFFANKQKG